jgi:hypothetical protein
MDRHAGKSKKRRQRGGCMRKMTLSEFRNYVKEHDDNKISHDEMKGGDFKKSFLLVCKKCGSTEVEFFGEAGTDYGEYTGYSSGENGFKCKSCGNAISWWQ